MHVNYINEDRDDIRENNEYKNQLLNNVKSATTTEKDIQNLKYKKSDLINYFTKYNNISTNNGKKGETKTSREQFFVKVTPGISLVSLSTKNNINSQLNVEFDNKITFKIGAEAEYVIPFYKNKWSLFSNPTYQKYKNEKNYSAPSNSAIENPETSYNVKIDYSSIQLPIGIRHYMFLNQTSKIFINAIYSFDINGKTHITYTNMTTGSNSKPNFESMSDTNLAFGLGYSFKNKFSVEARFNTKKELMNYSNYSAKYNAMDFVFAYTLF